MGKHESNFERVERDLYPTPPWCIEALAEHVMLTDLSVWEPAAGNGQMAEALKAAGAKVHATDVHPYGYKLDRVLDFTSGMHRAERFDAIVTNPPFGSRAKLAEQFVEIGLRHIARDGGFLALLLPVDFDAAKSRMHLFAGCPHFAGKIILTKRIIWFANPDKREAPKENHGWFLWQRSLIRGRQPVIRYAPINQFRHAAENLGNHAGELQKGY
jgi:hypothetical protein